jgi:hypothetical protein
VLLNRLQRRKTKATKNKNLSFTTARLKAKQKTSKSSAKALAKTQQKRQNLLLTNWFSMRLWQAEIKLEEFTNE